MMSFMTSDSDIDFVNYDKLATECNDGRKRFWTKLENDGMLVQYKSLLHLIFMHYLSCQ